MRNALISVSVVLLFISLLACGIHEPHQAESPEETADPISSLEPPTPEEAFGIIAQSPEFSDYEFTFASLSLPMTEATSNERTRQAALDLAAAGWIELDAAGSVRIGEKVASDKRFLVRPNGFLDIVPLAKKELVEVSSVGTTENGDVVAIITWKWTPNEVGASFTSGPIHERFKAQQAARATLMRSGETWSVLLIEKIEAPPEPRSTKEE